MLHDRQERRVDRVEADDLLLIRDIRRVDVAHARLDDVLEPAEAARLAVEHARERRSDRLHLSLRVEARDRLAGVDLPRVIETGRVVRLAQRDLRLDREPLRRAELQRDRWKDVRAVVVGAHGLHLIGDAARAQVRRRRLHREVERRRTDPLRIHPQLQRRKLLEALARVREHEVAAVGEDVERVGRAVSRQVCRGVDVRERE
jgi:hypothetical protein